MPSAFATPPSTWGSPSGALLAALIVDTARAGTFELIYLLDAVSFLLVIPVLFSVAALGVRHRDADAEPEPTGYRVVFADRAFVRLWLLTALLVLVGYGSFFSALPVLATEAGQLSASALSLVFAANTATVVVAQLIVLKLVRGRRRTRVVMVLAACWAATWAIVLVAGNAGGGTTGLVLYRARGGDLRARGDAACSDPSRDGQRPCARRPARAVTTVPSPWPGRRASSPGRSLRGSRSGMTRASC